MESEAVGKGIDMTDQITVPRATWDAMREALEEYLNKDNVELQINGIKSKAIEALTAANAVSEQPLKVTDLGRYALEPQAQREIEEWLDANRMQKIGSLHHELVARFVAHPQATEPAWRPIETAPKDGSEILAFNGENALMHWIEVHSYAAWEYADETLCEICPEADQPTHWMPLPAAPEAKQ